MFFHVSPAGGDFVDMCVLSQLSFFQHKWLSWSFEALWLLKLVKRVEAKETVLTERAVKNHIWISSKSAE